jgi:hypothetical protein
LPLALHGPLKLDIREEGRRAKAVRLAGDAVEKAFVCLVNTPKGCDEDARSNDLRRSQKGVGRRTLSEPEEELRERRATTREWRRGVVGWSCDTGHFSWVVMCDVIYNKSQKFGAAIF